MEEQAAQCGYCIAGMMMRAQALLQRNSKPTDEQIRAELEPHLCRCGTHMRILRAVHRTAQTDGHGGCVADGQRERPMNAPLILDRRRVLAGGGALIVSFSLTGALGAAAGRARCGSPAEPARQFENVALSRFLDPDRR